MLIRFLQNNLLVSFVLTAVRIYLGWSWLKAGWGKIAGGSFSAEGFLLGAVKKAGGENPSVQPWWADFLQSVAIPNVGIFNILVPWGELLVGLGLILGSFTAFAALMGMLMNFAYMFSGTTSTNPQMVVMELLIVAAAANASKIGVDRWFLPYLQHVLNPRKSKDPSLKSA
ncbi:MULTISPECIES: DoxX family membrane protein [Paenibacillus]|uniref:DoxX family membrane protein n=1 Tax=Paenibacillus TaxID=44249 RepID=UPI0022B8C571|nr:DoxX family membrane protein [Paenibacillus caseinilyticus]MCZ8522691.1 DoxX family membrane protein [Paenibacillus caseinilyticus]